MDKKIKNGFILVKTGKILGININKSLAGFTLIEIIAAVAILAILAGISVAGFVLFQKRTYLNSSANNFVEVLRTARNATLASENREQYGIYINVLVSPNQYTLFQGDTYLSRNQARDQNYSLEQGVSFSEVNLGGGSEINFDKLIGSSEQSGNIVLQYTGDINQKTTVYISNSGAVSFNPLSVPSGSERVTDSRHVHFNYNRIISYDAPGPTCAGETINLYFDGSASPQKQIPICSNITAGNIAWSGIIDVNGSSQKIEIRTHELNNPATTFSIHRDRALNTKSLIITISGDATGNIINYSNDGLTVNHTSAHSGNPIWQ